MYRLLERHDGTRAAYQLGCQSTEPVIHHQVRCFIGEFPALWIAGSLEERTWNLLEPRLAVGLSAGERRGLIRDEETPEREYGGTNHSV